MIDSQNKKISIFKKIISLGGLLVLLFNLFRKRKTIVKIVDEVTDDLVNGVKKIEHESEQKIIDYKEALHKRFGRWFKDFTIPHTGNNHHPKGLQPKALTGYVIVIFLVKLIVTGSLFFIYPSIGFVTSKLTDDLYKITNEERANVGLAPLVINSELVVAANRKAENMAAGHYFSHIGPDGTKPWEYIDKSKYDFNYMGENLAMDFSSAKIVHAAFMNSPSHKANILNKKYTDFGMALVPAEINERDTMILVQFYGKPKVTDSLATATNINNNEVVKTSVTTEPNVDSVIDNSAVTEVENMVFEPTTTTEPEVVSTDVDINTDTVVATKINSQASSTAVAQVDGISYFPSSELVVVSQPGTQKGLVDLLISWSRNFMTLMLVLVSMLLLVNIVVKFRVQHSHVILHSLLVITFIAFALFSRIHILEKLIY